MNFADLNIFLTLADTLHYGKTSKACNLSPSTLSRIIKRLEDDLGQQLFERDNRTVALTEAGRQFRTYARDAATRWKSFQDSLAGQHEVLQGEISMYCTITASYRVLPDILLRFRETYPAVHIKLLTGDSDSAIQKVVDGDADFAVAAMPDRIPEKLQFKPMTDIRLRFVAPAIPWPGMDMLNTKEIPWDRVPMIIAEKGMARKRINVWFHSQDITPDIYAQVTGNESILALVSLGLGVGIVPQLVLDQNLLSSNVQLLDIAPELEPYTVGICVLKRRIKTPLIKAFWDNI